MNARLYLIFFSAMVLCIISPLSVEAQKRNIPVDKPISNSRIPTDDPSAKIKSSKLNLSTLEHAVIEEINSARSNPQKYVGLLENYRKATSGNLIKLPNNVVLRIIEGVSVLDEAISDLKATSNLKTFLVSERLTSAARMQLKDLQEDSSLGHKGKNGSNLKTRLAQFVAIKGHAGENISHRSKTARDVAMLFIIDDGVKSRTHRKNVLSPTFQKIGVACGVGKNQESLCVTVFADDYADPTVGSKLEEF